MYAALGDAAAQAEIRRASPGKEHCKLLTDPKRGASFCKQCPNNPHLSVDPQTGLENPRAKLLDLVDEYGVAAEEALRLGLRLRYGMAPPGTLLEEEAALIAARELELNSARMQGNQIAAQLAEMLATMFGGNR